MKWEPIETAPKDKTKILLGYDWDDVIVVAYFGTKSDKSGKECWRVAWDDEGLIDHPTHWMPLLPLPDQRR